MRVIAGSARGTRLAAVPDGTRPMTDRTREAVFSSLGTHVTGARVLDLFAGTGAVGIEALSRGAESAVFVDSGEAAVRTIRENLRRAHLEGAATVLRRGALRAVEGLEPGSFDLVFLDPPYPLPAAELSQILAEIAERDILVTGGVIVLSRQPKSSMPVIPLDWRPERRRSYGAADIFVFRT